MAKNRKSPAKLTAVQAVEQVKAAFGPKGAKLTEDQLDALVDVVTRTGTAADAVFALQAIPAREPYGFARIMLMRRMWLVGRKFLNDHWMAEKFQGIPLMKAEHRKMVAQFGAAEVMVFLQPPHTTARFRLVEGSRVSLS